MMWILLAAVSLILPPVPGATNPDVTQDNIQTTICKSGFTGTIRPSVSYTNKLKKEQMQKYNLPGKPSDYEEDHLISLEIGGSPTDPNNLWPEAYAGEWGARKKDRIENKLHKMVCSNDISLRDAQIAISTNWIDAYKKYIGDN
jgi:hypothetical protein